ncbi:hypothetical protein EAF00_002325 [Botryotinia globosa]|nr:hypothetical protein EAF00_002325 [Botryotinia globosa]
MFIEILVWAMCNDAAAGDLARSNLKGYDGLSSATQTLQLQVVSVFDGLVEIVITRPSDPRWKGSKDLKPRVNTVIPTHSHCFRFASRYKEELEVAAKHRVNMVPQLSIRVYKDLHSTIENTLEQTSSDVHAHLCEVLVTRARRTPFHVKKWKQDIFEPHYKDFIGHMSSTQKFAFEELEIVDGLVIINGFPASGKMIIRLLPLEAEMNAVKTRMIPGQKISRTNQFHQITRTTGHWFGEKCPRYVAKYCATCGGKDHMERKCPQSKNRATLSKVAVSNTIKVREEAAEEGDAGEEAGDGTEEGVTVGEEAEEGVVSGEAWGSEPNDGGWGNGDDNGGGWNTETDAGAGNPSTDSAWY